MALKGNQHKIDKNKNNKIDAQDFKILRGEKKMKEESEQEETILEYESKEGVYRHKGTYGYEGKGEEHGESDFKKEKAEKTKKGYGARQNYVRSKKVSGKTYESFTAMMDEYKEQGIKGLFEAWKKKSAMKEEVEQIDEEYTLHKTKDDGEGYIQHDVHYKGKKIGHIYADGYGNHGYEYHARGTGDTKYSSKAKALQSLKSDHKHDMSMKEEVEQVEERTLTEPEMNKREEVVKSMKKNLAGFKDRYGDKAKSVMYATATKIAKKD